MVIGVPNVGKSSFINSLRRTNLKKGGFKWIGESCWYLRVTGQASEGIKKIHPINNISGRASRVGGEPGITRAVLTKIQVSHLAVFLSLHVLHTVAVLYERCMVILILRYVSVPQCICWTLQGSCLLGLRVLKQAWSWLYVVSGNVIEKGFW